MAPRKTHVSTLILAAAVGAAAPLVVFVPGAPAQDQTATGARSYLITNADDTAVRSGADLAWYVVGQFDKGTVLKMEGQLDNWFRVEYPAGTPAVVKTTDGELHKDKGVVTLTRRSSLLAYNLLNPYMEDCYKRLFADQPLPPGTELKYIGPLENRRGEVAGYKVVAPAGAEGFVLPANVRPATPEEVRAIVGAPAPTTTEAAKPSESATPSEPEPTQPEPSTAQQAEPAAQRPAPASGSDYTEIEMGKPAASRPTQPAPGTPGAPTQTTAEAPAPTPAPKPQASNVEPRRLDDVDAAYKQVMKQDIENAEFSQLIDEYNAILASLPDTEDNALERQYIQQRIELLQMRAQLQTDMRNLATLETQAASAQENLDAYVKKIQAARGYVVVGKLAPSIVYDGKRLPRMFRVVSVDAATGGRTLAYVLPNPDLNMVGKLGSLVGIQGDDDPTARRGEVRVIKPTGVDVLTTEAAAPAPAKPATPAATVSDGSDTSGS